MATPTNFPDPSQNHPSLELRWTHHLPGRGLQQGCPAVFLVRAGSLRQTPRSAAQPQSCLPYVSCSVLLAESSPATPCDKVQPSYSFSCGGFPSSSAETENMRAVARLKGSFVKGPPVDDPKAVFPKADPYAFLEMVPSSKNCLGDL